MKVNSMEILSFEVGLKPDDITWEEQKARLATLPKIPDMAIFACIACLRGAEPTHKQ